MVLFIQCSAEWYSKSNKELRYGEEHSASIVLSLYSICQERICCWL